MKKEEPKRHLVTAALPYANGPVHIGHLAGCYLPADIYVRYLRKAGKDVKFICGTDEHGAAIHIKARQEGKSPREVVDHYHRVIDHSFRDFGISFDIFSRTSKEIHHQTAQDFFLKLYEQGSLNERESEQFYDPEAGEFLADRFIQGECPNCGFEEAYGDQCERCGRTLSPDELGNPKSRLSGAAPEKRKTRHWFLPLDHLSDKIRTYLQKHQDWKPNVHGQCMSWLDSGDGLQARSMTRDLDWGIPVPLKEAEGKVLYVWFDAPLGYISATKELLGDDWRAYWQGDDSELIHFIGKDNIVFHCIIFPALLMEHGDYRLPDEVPANEFLNLEGAKISTSRNWAVWLHEYLEDFPGRQDSLRYTLCANAPETKDNDFTWREFQSRNNNELVAVLGNFVNRVLTLIAKYYQGAVPGANTLEAADRDLMEEIAESPSRIAKKLEKFRFREAQAEMMNLARAGNKYLAEQEPWKKQKTDPGRTATILHIACQTAAQLSQVMEPFLPHLASRLRDYLHLETIPWTDLGKAEFIPAGAHIDKGDLLVQKIEDEQIEAQLAKLKEPEAKAEKPVTPVKPEIDFEAFQAMDLRVGEVLSAEAVPKADKLLKMEVDLGFEKRVIVSGIKQHFTLEDLPGQRVLVLLNLAPRKIRGVESQGMILMAESEEGKLYFVEPQPGSEAGDIVR